MDNQEYATYPGCTKADNQYCLTCIWHGILAGRWVCCDYSLSEYHGKRDCKPGVGCKYHDTGKRPTAAPRKRKRRNMSTCDPQIFRVLVEFFGKQRMEEITGYSRTGLDNAKATGRIRTSAATALLRETGIDITGGELNREG